MHQHTDNLIAEKQEVKPFYVYIHRHADDGKVFYVGKGKRDRCKSASGRNQHWNSVAAKHGFTYHIVMRFNSEVCAYSFEKALIKRYGIDNLSNMTDGGDGGFKVTEHVLERMRSYQSGHNNPRYDPTVYHFFHATHGAIICSKYDFRKKTGAAKSNIRNLVNGKRKTAFGWVCLGKCPVS